jgi:hypothetical protein
MTVSNKYNNAYGSLNPQQQQNLQQQAGAQQSGLGLNGIIANHPSWLNENNEVLFKNRNNKCYKCIKHGILTNGQVEEVNISAGFGISNYYLRFGDKYFCIKCFQESVESLCQPLKELDLNGNGIQKANSIVEDK